LVAPRIKASPWVVLVVLTLGFFMINLDATIVQVALPRMEQGLNTGFDEILWVMNAYTLVYAVLLIPAARLGDLFGPKRLFIGGLALFTLGSAACALSQSGAEVLLSRVVQAAGGALLTPQTMTVINTLFPPERRGAAFGVWGIVAGVSTSVGPTLGGYLITTFDWQAIFLINVPVGVLAIAAAYLVMPEIHFSLRRDLDLRGVLLASAGLLLGVFALVEGQRYSWGPIDTFGALSLGATRWSLVSIYSLLVYAVLLLVVFAVVERRARQPLLPFPLFGDRNFIVGTLLAVVVSFAMASMFIPIVLFSQSVLGWSAVKSGLTALPYTLVALVVAPLAGRLSDRINGKYILLVGCAVSVLGTGLLRGVLALDNTPWSFVLPLAVAGFGMGCTMVPMTVVTMRDVPPALSGAASGFVNTLRQVGAALGTAVVGAVLANQVAAALPAQAARLATHLPSRVRPSFVAQWTAASHSAQQFGVGQQGASITLPPGVSPALAHQLVAIAQEVFAWAFLDGARAALITVMLAMAVAAVVTLGLRGGRTAQEARLQPPKTPLQHAA
jgi:EmrB/QacA subfamily drug resistance transporter